MTDDFICKRCLTDGVEPNRFTTRDQFDLHMASKHPDPPPRPVAPSPAPDVEGSTIIVPSPESPVIEVTDVRPANPDGSDPALDDPGAPPDYMAALPGPVPVGGFDEKLDRMLEHFVAAIGGLTVRIGADRDNACLIAGAITASTNAAVNHEVLSTEDVLVYAARFKAEMGDPTREPGDDATRSSDDGDD